MYIKKDNINKSIRTILFPLVDISDKSPYCTLRLHVLTTAVKGSLLID